ncbi:type II pantothenate kinase [Lentibacillus halodurans]|uniref:Type II pantothenate kinase n=1 Tax=Lentibacillus halodurans TaxID=237679 RepID=A0A1I0X2M1_9BACI|nr:type II pantothenate kinase [Lentibacillus halodurans]SFA94606.1 type II pantothenate kinase [Lentibacillus halodurans]
MNQTKIGIDAGGTLLKIAYVENDALYYRSFRSRDIDRAASWLTDHFENPAICVTGGKSHALAEKLNVPAKTVLEFDATTQGMTYLADQLNHPLGNDFLFVNVGTGTSIHYVHDGKQERVGGSGVGGGTLLGIGFLATDMQDYEKIIQAASEGNRENVDLKVKDIFDGSVPPISGDLTASNFGKTEILVEQPPSDPDILASIIGLVGEVIVTISSQLAVQYDADTIVYIGSSFRSNPLLQQIIEKYTRMIGKTPLFLENGEYSGAVGALLATY